MKNIFLLMSALLMIYGCKAEQGVRFCEGVNTEGEGVKCGSVFSAGELLLLINVKEEFGADRLTMNIYEKKKFKKEVFETRALNVKPEEMKTTADLKLYKEGEYVVDVTGRDNAVIARGEVKIVETY